MGEAAGVELGGRREAAPSSPVGHGLLDSQGMALKNDRLGLGTTVYVYLGLGQVRHTAPEAEGSLILVSNQNSSRR